MRVLLFSLEYPPYQGGVANYYENLIKHWPNPAEIFVLHNNDHKLISRSLPFLKWLPAFFTLRQTIKKLKIEHILVGQILPLGIVAWLLNRMTGIKYSVIIHGMDFAYALKVGRKKMITGKILNQAEKIICSNSYTAGLVSNFLGQESNSKIITINPGIDNRSIGNQQTADKLRDQYKLNNKLVLLSVGRLVKRKGFDLVDATLPEILKTIPDLVYVIIGNEAELKNSQFKNALVINQASNEERNAWYELCDIFIMPSREINGDFEGFGIVYLEANLAGKPVIAGRSGGVADAVIDNLNGLLINPEDPNEISQAIIKLAENPELRKKLGERGKERVLNEFNWQKQIEKIYNSVHA